MKNKKQNFLFIFPIIAIVALCIALYVKSIQPADINRESVKVSVNGIELNEEYGSDDAISNTDDSGMPNIIQAEDTTILHNNNTQTVTKNYCGNKNSKVFHTTDCSFSAKTKDENKVYFSSREEFISNGYRACSKCNP